VRELSDYAQEDVRAAVSVVAQTTHLFNTTIRENLLVARRDATDEDLIRAAKQAHVYSFIKSLPQGFDTPVGEQGLNLSGGERQRIAIARAFLKDAPVLVLDEATANLDALTEREILGTLRQLVRGRTTIIITHRLVGLDMADEILVMQDGAIVERGHHRDLVQLEGLYWKMLQVQNEVLSLREQVA
jgi:ATP-binding cassette subfamily C protein CydC